MCRLWHCKKNMKNKQQTSQTCSKVTVLSVLTYKWRSLRMDEAIHFFYTFFILFLWCKIIHFHHRTWAFIMICGFCWSDSYLVLQSFHIIVNLMCMARYRILLIFLFRILTNLPTFATSFVQINLRKERSSCSQGYKVVLQVHTHL